jgi:hypothetical protein
MQLRIAGPLGQCLLFAQKLAVAALLRGDRCDRHRQDLPRPD